MTRLAPDETITFRARTGAHIVVHQLPPAAGSSSSRVTYEAACAGCRMPSRADCTDPDAVTLWARTHAGECTALPADYVDVAAKATGHAAEAERLLTMLRGNQAAEVPHLLTRIETHTRLAGIYAELAHRS